MEQEHRITYKAGITRTPSDFLCQDGELAECINLVTDNEELKPVVQPAPFITEALDQDGQTEIDIPDILYIHKFNDQERYIYKRQIMSAGQPVVFMAWGTVSGTTLTQIRPLEIETGELFYDSSMKITSVGKVLLISKADTNSQSPLNYFIWKANDYKNYNIMPQPKIKFWLNHYRYSEGGGLARYHSYVTSSQSCDGILEDNGSRLPDIVDKDAYEDLIKGLYAKNKKEIGRLKSFCNPFLIRAALELNDGTYHYITNPILLFPSVTRNTYGYMGDKGFYVHTTCCQLYCTQEQDFSDFSDLIKDVKLFVTDGIDVNDAVSDAVLNLFNQNGYTSDRITGSHESTDSTYVQIPVDPINLQVLKEKDHKEIVNDIRTEPLFYKLCGIGLKPISGKCLVETIETHTLENIRTQDRLEHDDFYSRCLLSPEFLYAYNSRLNIANTARSFFEGYDFFMPFDNSSESTYRFYVTIETDSGNYTVCHEKTTNQKQGIFFYYPDSRAKHVQIYKNGTRILDENLTEHPGLNGAYFLKGLPGIDEQEPSGTTEQQDPPSYNNLSFERLPNYIIQSEVNNPWVFKAEGYHKVGTGKIIGMSTTTQALSQGQFGQYPLLVFSESGIWAMSVDRTGLYDSISPMSRDVCINPGSILQTDGAVFFVSKKGLMAVAGNEVVCVSERMNGAAFDTATLTPLATETDWEDIVEACQGSNSFLDYIRDTSMFMAYDYIDSRIVMMNPHYDYSFVYNIADGTISKVILPADMTNAVNNYPDYLIQGRKPNDQVWVYSFYEKPREEEVADRSLAFLLTRPMKLAGPVSQASLRQLKNVGTWIRKDMQGNPLSCVKTEVYLSEDMHRWYPDKSRHGAAARYYRLALYIKMLPTERLSGTILTEQERRSHNMR